MVLIAFGFGCAPSAAEQLQEALKSGQCETVRDVSTRDECWLSHLQCSEVTDPRLQRECAFRAAEASGNAADCVAAGEWADDCRLHLFGSGMRKWAPSDPTPGRAEAEVEAAIPRHGLSVTDPRPWSAWYRYALTKKRPFDRASCAGAPDAMRQEACRQTGLAAYDDLLNVARDRRLYPCDGGALPPILEHTPDPDIDALIARRTDLCP